MDSNSQSFPVYPLSQLTPSSAHASVADSSWHHPRISSHQVSLTSGPSPSMFPVTDRPDMEYPSPAPSNASPPYAHAHPDFTAHPQSPSLHISPSNDSMLSHFAQVDSRVGPSRVMTRRQRAQMEQKNLGRRGSLQHHFQRDQLHSPRHNGLYPGTARLHTPNNEDSAQLQRDRLSLNITSAVPLPLQSPSYHPMTPTSMTSPSYSPYHMYGHSRSTSGSTSNHQRAPSPALSCASVLTSVSSASGPHSHAFTPYPRPNSNSLPTVAGSKPKQKKQRLDNNARKNICLYHDEHPNARQEDIAAVFKVERSTISKILKHKSKWLSTPDNQGDRVAKHRPSKFPEIEDELEKWLEDCTIKKTTISDNLIRARAKETARRLSISEEKFKASSGWVENFKSRHNIRGGAWLGYEKLTSQPNPQNPRLVDTSRDILSPLNPAFPSRAEGCGDMHGTSTQHRDEDMDSQEGQDNQDLSASEQQMSVSAPPPAMSVQTSWEGAAQSMSHSPLSAHAHAVKPPSAIHDHPLHPQHTPASEHAQYMDEQTMYYQPEPPAPAALPTLADAEAAMNTLITFVDSARRDLLLPVERRTLNTIRYALFQEANNIPFDRSTQA